MVVCPHFQHLKFLTTNKLVLKLRKKSQIELLFKSINFSMKNPEIQTVIFDSKCPESTPILQYVNLLKIAF